MNIAIISGSQREGSQTRRVCDFLQNNLMSKNIQTTLLDLSTSPLPLNSSPEAKTETGKKAISSYLEILSNADGLIFATPEWAGAATPALLNALSLAEKTIAHKPVMIVTVSAARGGSYPVAEIRSFGSKNNKAVFIPDHIIVHNVKEVLIDNAVEEKADLYIRERIDWSLNNLIAYAKYLKGLREEFSIQLLDDRFGNGMS